MSFSGRYFRLAQRLATTRVLGATIENSSAGFKNIPNNLNKWQTCSWNVARAYSAQPQKTFEEFLTDESNKMFCFQCEQTTGTRGCTTVGVCGKTPETAALQDLLVHCLKGLGAWAHRARAEIGYDNSEVDLFINQAMFSTLTNVNFDEPRFADYLLTCHRLQEEIKTHMHDGGISTQVGCMAHWGGVPDPMSWNIVEAVNHDTCVTNFMDIGHQVGIMERHQKTNLDPTVTGLVELVTYGLKGVCAYLHHAEMLKNGTAECTQGVQECLHFLTTKDAHDPAKLLEMCLKLGELNIKVLKQLDEAHNESFGTPSPQTVSRDPVEGKAILVSGHDLADLEAVLEQTEFTGINVYTHGEMLPAHSYPNLAKYSHLKGHYGGAWYKQKKDFHKFPGAILMTSNCIIEPLSTYRHKIFTTGAVGVGRVEHLPNKEFGPVVDAALALPGFSASDVQSSKGGPPLTVGFGHSTVLGVAGDVLDAVKAGKLSHVFLIGGCDGSEPSRKYYSNLAKNLPQDTITLTLGCAKFRLVDQDWGTLPGTGLPRLLDMGQCNDSYSAVVVAQALADALGTDVNGLPLSLDISWFEQKAVAVLLSLLHLGVRNIRLGPRMPAFLTPEATAILVEKFNIQPADIGSPEGDIKLMMANK